MSDSAAIRAHTQDIFYGIDERVSACDGAIADAKNLWSDDYPSLSTRAYRYYRQLICDAGATCYGAGSFGDKVYYAASNKFYFDGQEIGTLSDGCSGLRDFCEIGDSVCIFPDKLMYTDMDVRLDADEAESLLSVEQYHPNSSHNDITVKLPVGVSAALLVGRKYAFAMTGSYDGEVNPVIEAVVVAAAFSGSPDDGKRNVNLTLSNDIKRGANLTLTHGVNAVCVKRIEPMEREMRIVHGKTVVGGEKDYLCYESLEYTEFDEALNYALFSVGESVTVDGFDDAGNNVTAIIRGKDTQTVVNTTWARLWFDAGTFATAESFSTTVAAPKVTVKRYVPKLDFYCTAQNRLFGCGVDGICASTLGNPLVWGKFDGLSTDAWAVAVQGDGDFTGCATYAGAPIFFKSDRLYKLYGDNAAEYSLYELLCLGVKKGAAKSICVSPPYLMYLSQKGICAYSGSYPQVVSEHLIKQIVPLSSGSDGRKYYLSAEYGGENMLLVYDTWTKMWHKETGQFSALFGGIYGVTSDCRLWTVGDTKADVSMTKEASMDCICESADMFFESPDMKGLSKIRIRAKCDDDVNVAVYISYDDGEYESLGSFSSEALRNNLVPVLPRRCDHYRLKLIADGRIRVQSITTEFYFGSGTQGGYNV